MTVDRLLEQEELLRLIDQERLLRGMEGELLQLIDQEVKHGSPGEPGYRAKHPGTGQRHRTLHLSNGTPVTVHPYGEHLRESKDFLDSLRSDPHRGHHHAARSLVYLITRGVQAVAHPRNKGADHDHSGLTAQHPPSPVEEYLTELVAAELEGQGDGPVDWDEVAQYAVRELEALVSNPPPEFKHGEPDDAGYPHRRRRLGFLEMQKADVGKLTDEDLGKLLETLRSRSHSNVWGDQYSQRLQRAIETRIRWVEEQERARNLSLSRPNLQAPPWKTAEEDLESKHGEPGDPGYRQLHPRGRRGVSTVRPDSAHRGQVYRTRSVAEAVRLLGQGHNVELKSPRQVSTLLDRLAKIVREAEAKGEDAPVYDLCRVSVKNTNLFCAQSKGYPRVKMPQFSGKPKPGTKADRLPASRRNAKGQVDLTDEFRTHLEAKGLKVTDASEKASYLKATQNELLGNKVAGMVKAYKEGKLPPARLYVSRDNYVVDGHHRWAAVVGVDLEDDVEADLSMDVARIDLDIIPLLAEANKFAEAWGIPGAAVGDTSSVPDKKEAALAEWAELKVSRGKQTG